MFKLNLTLMVQLRYTRCINFHMPFTKSTHTLIPSEQELHPTMNEFDKCLLSPYITFHFPNCWSHLSHLWLGEANSLLVSMVLPGQLCQHWGQTPELWMQSLMHY